MRPISLWNLTLVKKFDYCKMKHSQLRDKISMSSKHNIKRNKQRKWPLKNCYANKCSKTRIAIRFNLPQVSPSAAFFYFLYYLYLHLMF